MCLEIAAGLAMCIPGRVLTELASTALLHPGQGAMLPTGMLLERTPSMLAFSQGVPGLQQLAAHHEERQATFPVTLAFLHLTSTLLDGGLSDETLQASSLEMHAIRPLRQACIALYTHVYTTTASHKTDVIRRQDKS